jgi:hypothetical protein
MSWARAISVGVLGSVFMMLLVDIFAMLNITPFSYEAYIGSAFGAYTYSPYQWLFGFFANLVMGALWGLAYAYFFESVFRRSNAKLGTLMGFAHAAVAGLLLFPFFNAALDQLGTGIYPHFGFLGAAVNATTFFLIVISHLAFGLTMGTLYGPVRAERMQALDFEPGETGLPGEKGVVTEEQDPIDRASA